MARGSGPGTAVIALEALEISNLPSIAYFDDDILSTFFFFPK